MSASPPKVDTLTGGLDVSFVPLADVDAWSACSPHARLTLEGADSGLATTASTSDAVDVFALLRCC
jgi:hypothetical protein